MLLYFKFVIFLAFASSVLGRSFFPNSMYLLAASTAKEQEQLAPKDCSNDVPPYDFKIYTEGEKELTMSCLTVSPSLLKSPEVREMRENLFHVLKKFRAKMGFGRAIAAPQLGYPFRMIALHYNNTDTTLHNPVIINHSYETFTLWDDCLSFPDKMVSVQRYKQISVQFITEKNEVVVWNDCPQDLSELLQHEIDHLNGVLAVDKAVPPNVNKDRPDVPKPIVSREDWLKRKDFYNQFVDFHY